jgi:hypothetical protein
MTWAAINNQLHAQGNPDIDYDRFAARWETDPILKQLVDRFDGHGLVIKTNKGETKPAQGKPAPSKMADAAKRATRKGKMA